MSDKQRFEISYSLVDSPELLNDSDRHLLQVAYGACERSYSPYSQFKVGAAVLLENGEIVEGANQENASFPLGSCGEHVAINAANVQFPETPVVAVAIVAVNHRHPVNEPVMPCGGCRQVLCETERRFKHPIRIILRGQTGKIAIFDQALDLLPFAFELIID